MRDPLIHLGGVKVPLLDYAVSCNAILGIRDSGKTVTAKGIAEQILDHDVPIVVFDAVGKWRFMKVPGPGARGRGYKVVVAGGRAPDLALNAHSVGEIVRSAVKERIPLIIDLYDPNLSKADWRRIVQESIRIIHYEAVGVAHVFLEEAAEFIPQKPQDFNTYAEVEKLARMGGNASVGITIINQRAQEVNKAVLDLAVNLILGCQVGSKAIEWIGKWLDRLSPETAKAVTTSLPKLKSGEAWVWTRSNLDEPLREQMPMCRSLHPDRRTPEIALKSAKAINPVEFVDKLNAAIPKLVEEEKANDPVLLRKKIAELEKNRAPREQDTKRIKDLEAALEKALLTKREVKSTVEKKIVIAGDLTRIENEGDRVAVLLRESRRHTVALEQLHEKIGATIVEAKALNAQQVQVAAPSQALKVFEPGFSKPSPPVIRPREATGARSIPSSNGDSPANITGGALRILQVLASKPDLKLTKPQLGTLAKMKHTGGSFSTYMSRLRSANLITTDGRFIQITDEGIDFIGVDRLPEPLTSEEVLQQWLNTPAISGGAANMLKVLFRLRREGKGLTRAALADEVNMAMSGGSFSTYLSRLRSNGLIQEQGGIIYASDTLFINE